VRDDRNSPAADILAGPDRRGAEVRYPAPHVVSFQDAGGTRRESVGLDTRLDWAEVILVVTPHHAIDWERVYATADLVVDTVDASKHRSTRDRQVLRLGAGWSSRPGPTARNADGADLGAARTADTVTG
jgi:UDP-N-acetyl-D-mannosaminuronate dehydrogenase